jgi:hypothetical protein
MEHEVSLDTDTLDFELLEWDIVHCQAAGQLSEMDRKQRRRKIPGQPGSQIRPSGAWPPDVDLSPRLKQRWKEAEPLDVISVEM